MRLRACVVFVVCLRMCVFACVRVRPFAEEAPALLSQRQTGSGPSGAQA